MGMFSFYPIERRLKQRFKVSKVEFDGYFVEKSEIYNQRLSEAKAPRKE